MHLKKKKKTVFVCIYIPFHKHHTSIFLSPFLSLSLSLCFSQVPQSLREIRVRSEVPRVKWLTTLSSFSQLTISLCVFIGWPLPLRPLHFPFHPLLTLTLPKEHRVSEGETELCLERSAYSPWPSIAHFLFQPLQTVFERSLKWKRGVHQLRGARPGHNPRTPLQRWPAFINCPLN